MTARNDYPAHRALLPGAYELDGQLYENAMDEIDRLRRWRSEAIDVLSEWQLLADHLAAHATLGQSQAKSALAYVRELEARLQKTCGCV